MTRKCGFIFSLPRSGSTYVQRVLSGAPEVATMPEPWLMPALMGIRYGRAPAADFAYDHVRAGLDDILNSREDGEAVWARSVRAMAEEFYSNFAETNQICIDKTPRNAAFASQIARCLPDAPMLFLWRNPLAVVHSINETWGQGKWKAYFYEYDLRVGLPGMIQAWDELQSRPNVMAVKYEDLAAEPETHWPAIFDHFGATYDAALVAAPPRLMSRMGDRTGQEKYDGTSSASIVTWETGFGSRIRKHWARQYLRELGHNALAKMGYSLEDIEHALSRSVGRSRISDYGYIPMSRLYHKVDPYLLREKLRRDGPKTFAIR